MGMDARGYFITKRLLTAEEIIILNKQFIECNHAGWDGAEKPFYQIDKAQFGIHFDLSRYYDFCYARGPAHKIYAVLGWLRRHPIVESVYYGSDVSDLDELYEWTAERETEEIGEWLKHGYKNYHPKTPPIEYVWE